MILKYHRVTHPHQYTTQPTNTSSLQLFNNQQTMSNPFNYKSNNNNSNNNDNIDDVYVEGSNPFVPEPIVNNNNNNNVQQNNTNISISNLPTVHDYNQYNNSTNIVNKAENIIDDTIYKIYLNKLDLDDDSDKNNFLILCEMLQQYMLEMYYDNHAKQNKYSIEKYIQQSTQRDLHFSNDVFVDITILCNDMELQYPNLLLQLYITPDIILAGLRYAIHYVVQLHHNKFLPEPVVLIREFTCRIYNVPINNCLNIFHQQYQGEYTQYVPFSVLNTLQFKNCLVSLYGIITSIDTQTTVCTSMMYCCTRHNNTKKLIVFDQYIAPYVKDVCDQCNNKLEPMPDTDEYTNLQTITISDLQSHNQSIDIITTGVDVYFITKFLALGDIVTVNGILQHRRSNVATISTTYGSTKYIQCNNIYKGSVYKPGQQHSRDDIHAITHVFTKNDYGFVKHVTEAIAEDTDALIEHRRKLVNSIASDRLMDKPVLKCLVLLSVLGGCNEHHVREKEFNKPIQLPINSRSIHILITGNDEQLHDVSEIMASLCDTVDVASYINAVESNIDYKVMFGENIYTNGGGMC